MLSSLRHSIRALQNSPGFTLVAVVTLALAIAADCVVFSVADAVMFRPLPYKDPDRLVNVWWRTRGSDVTRGPSFPDFLDWKRRNGVFEDMAFAEYSSGVMRIGEYPESVQVGKTTVNLFDLLGVKPILGRAFSADQRFSGPGDEVAVLSHDFWQGRFRGDPNILGRRLDFSGRKVSVIGVLPAGFRFTYPKEVQIWLPVLEDKPRSRYAGGTPAIARLKPGVTPPQAEAGMKPVLEALAREYPETNRFRLEARVISIQGWTARQFKVTLWTLLGAVTFVLLIGCANLANLLLARLTDRERETLVRAALGAGRWRLVRQFLAESLLVGLMAGGLGLLLSSWGLDAVRSVLPSELPRGDEVSLDGRVVVFALALSLATSLAFGLIPALKCSKVNISEGLAGSAASTGMRRNRGFRAALVASEIALALVLTGGSGLMMNSFIRLMRVDLGFNPDNVLIVNAPPQRYQNRDSEAQAMERLMDEVRAIPGVQQVGEVLSAPLIGGYAHARVRSAPGLSEIDVRFNVVAGDYFGAMQIPLRAGRVFHAQDTSRSERVVVINESLARLLFPTGGAVGRQFHWGSRAVRTVGVVADVRYNLLSAPEPEVYAPAAQTDLHGHVFVVRYKDTGTANLAGSIRKRMYESDPDALISIRSFKEAVTQQGAQLRFLTMLMGGAGLLGLLLSASGVFGVTAYAVGRRRREIGVRMALGAARNDVMRMILREGAVTAAAGVVLGTAVFFALGRVMRSMLFEVKPFDPLTLAAVLVVLALATLAANYIPARRALSVDPALTLRHE